MICTDEERDDLLELINQYGNARSDEIHLRCVVVAMESTSDVAVAAARQGIDRIIAAIRAMLAPPDDAVVIPRALAERAVTAFCVEAKYHAEDDMVNQSHAATDDAEALRAVLRGEATRDE